MTGTSITLQAPDADAARRFSKATGAGTVLNTKATNWHIYYHWDYILEKRSANGKGWPWKFGDWESPVTYSNEMCPNTQDILQRCFNGLDCLHVDGVDLAREPYACHCSKCLTSFHVWLVERYPTFDAQKARFGFTPVD